MTAPTQNQGSVLDLLTSGRPISLEHQFDWDDALKIGAGVFVGALLAIIIGHSLLKLMYGK